MILGKNGLAVFVAEKADAVLADKLSELAAIAVLEKVVVLDLAPPRERSNKPAGENAGVVAEAPKMLPETGSVLVAVVDDTMLDLLLSDKTWAKIPPALVDVGKPDGVTLVSLFSDGVPLEDRETWPGIVLEVGAGSLETAVGATPKKLLVLPAAPPGADARIRELKMLGGLLLVSPPLPNTLPAMVAVERLRFVKKPSPAGFGAENGYPCVAVAGVAIPLEPALDEFVVVTCRACLNIKTPGSSSTLKQLKCIINRCHVSYN